MPDRAIMRFLTTRAWMLHLPVLERLVDVVAMHARLEKIAPEQVKLIVEDRETRKDAVRRDRRLAGRKLIARQFFGDERDERLATTDGGIGILFIDGVLSKYADQINGSSQPKGVSTGDIIDGLYALASDGQVRQILLDIDSPGGTVAGMDDVKEAIRSVSDESGKPVVAYAHDLCASGGYFIASSADAVFCNPAAEIGSIGVYTVYDDLSAIFADFGIRRVVVRTDPDKGIGVPGVEITDEQVEVIQQEINALGTWFKGHVAARRGLSIEQVRALGARCYIGADAAGMGLADGVMGFSDLVRAMEEDAIASARA